MSNKDLSQTHHPYASQFRSLRYVIGQASRILLFAHKNPDSDTIGSVCALRFFLREIGKSSDIACFDAFPKSLHHIFQETFRHPDSIDLTAYDAIIACDSVERGFHLIQHKLGPNQVVALLDHHPDITIKGDINIIDSTYSSTCELLYDFFRFSGADISKNVATALLLGILGDTGNFQHANTSTHVLEVGADLLKRGAPLHKIANFVFSNKKLSTLQLWGKAFNKARFNENTGMIVTVITKDDILSCDATTEDISQVANILATVPGVRFALILTQKNSETIKASLRSEESGDTDVSLIAALFGGGGHKLASGFEVRGQLAETADGWFIH